MEDEEYGEKRHLMSGDVNSIYSDRNVSTVSETAFNEPLSESFVAPKKHYPIWYRALLMAILVCSGAAMTLCIKNQDETCYDFCDSDHDSYCVVSCPEDDHHGSDSSSSSSVFGFLSDEGGVFHFHQPFIQLFHLGLGQLCSGVFTPLFANKDDNSLRPIPFLKFFPQAALASVFDVTAEILVILGISMTLPSVTEMLKTTMVVFVGVLSLYFFPGFEMNWKQWVSSAVMFSGALIVILQPYIKGDSSGDALAEIGGACLVVAAQLFYAMEFVVEEKLMDHAKFDGYHVNKAILVVALGVLSMGFAITLQIPYTLVTSTFQDFYLVLQMYFTTTVFWLSGIGISLAVMGFDLAGLGISEIMGSDRRAISVAAFQVAIVWSISIFVGWEVFSLASLLGFILILSSGGAYVYFSKEKSGAHGPKSKH